MGSRNLGCSNTLRYLFCRIDSVNNSLLILFYKLLSSTGCGEVEGIRKNGPEEILQELVNYSEEKNIYTFILKRRWFTLLGSCGSFVKFFYFRLYHKKYSFFFSMLAL